MNIRPIRTDEDHAATLRRIDDLMDAEPGSPGGDELDVLVTLVEAYEDRHFPIDDPDPLAAIRFRMEQMGLTRRDLEPLLGSPWPRLRSAERSAGLVDTDDPPIASRAGHSTRESGRRRVM
jgi:antitoxin component HigA of HigAB toxin-antitoxin module